MCGIIGACGKKPKIDILEDLILLNLHRGGQNGKGIWSNKQGLLKGLNISLPSALKKRKTDRQFLIHLRWATSGAINSQNCHPFEKHNIVFCHNGHIWNYKRFGVDMDSRAGFKVVLNGLRGLEQLSGSYVFVWFDLSKKTLNIINHNGQIEFGWDKDALYFASENILGVLKKGYACLNNSYFVFDMRTGKSISCHNLKKLLPNEDGFWSRDSIYEENQDVYVPQM